MVSTVNLLLLILTINNIIIIDIDEQIKVLNKIL